MAREGREPRQALETLRCLQQAGRHSTAGDSSNHREHSRGAALLHLPQRLRRLEASIIPSAIHHRLRDGFQPSIRRVHREEPHDQLDLGDHHKPHHNRYCSFLRRHIAFLWRRQVLRSGFHDLGVKWLVLGMRDTWFRAQISLLQPQIFENLK